MAWKRTSKQKENVWQRHEKRKTQSNSSNKKTPSLVKQKHKHRKQIKWIEIKQGGHDFRLLLLLMCNQDDGGMKSRKEVNCFAAAAHGVQNRWKCHDLKKCCTRDDSKLIMTFDVTTQTTSDVAMKMRMPPFEMVQAKWTAIDTPPHLPRQPPCWQQHASECAARDNRNCHPRARPGRSASWNQIATTGSLWRKMLRSTSKSKRKKKTMEQNRKQQQATILSRSNCVTVPWSLFQTASSTCRHLLILISSLLLMSMLLGRQNLTKLQQACWPTVRWSVAQSSARAETWRAIRCASSRKQTMLRPAQTWRRAERRTWVWW